MECKYSIFMNPCLHGLHLGIRRTSLKALLYNLNPDFLHLSEPQVHTTHVKRGWINL